MRILSFTLLVITLSLLSNIKSHESESLEFLTDFTPAVEAQRSLNDITFKVYSMVWSAKYYNPSEQKTFFFAVPMSFNTIMKINTETKNIHIEFPNYKNSMENFKYVVEDGKKAEVSSFNKIVKFSEGYSKIDLSLNLKGSEYSLANIKVYQNTFAKSVEIKITQPLSKHARALYVTFDLAKGETVPEDVGSFVDFLTKIQTETKPKK